MFFITNYFYLNALAKPEHIQFSRIFICFLTSPPFCFSVDFNGFIMVYQCTPPMDLLYQVNYILVDGLIQFSFLFAVASPIMFMT